MLWLLAVAGFFMNAQSATLNITISTGYPPFYYKENGVLKGLCIEVIDATLKRMGMQASLSPNILESYA